MSFEGYYQKICKNGHSYTADLYYYGSSFNDDVTKCPFCEESEVWSNMVNTTNGSYDVDPVTGEETRIDGFIEIEIDQPAPICTCSCGNKHELRPATYKIPKAKEEEIEETCGFCYGSDIDFKEDAGWDIDTEGEERQHHHRCLNCWAERWAFDRIDFIKGAMKREFGSWMKVGSEDDKETL
jgi:hypothetical protein